MAVSKVMREEPIELRSLQFCMRSNEEVVAASAFELVSPKMSGGEYGTVMDPRGGATRNSRCETCLQSEVHCPGHFGHLVIDSPVLHPLFLNNAVAVLRMICARCHRFLFNKHRLSYAGIDNMSGARRLERISELVDGKGVTCVHCGASPVMYALANYNPKPGSNAPSTYHVHRRVETPNRGVVDYPLSDTEIATILEDVPEQDVALIGIDPSKFLIRAFPVIPMRCTKQNETGSQVDDLFTLIRDMVKLNAAAKSEETPELERIVAQHELREKIYIFISNSENRKSSNADRGRPIEGIIDRIRGKRGLIRNNLMGKRSVMTARTVIGPDPTLRLDEVSVARELADALTVPLNVHEHNLKHVAHLVKNGRATRVERDGHVINLEMSKEYEPRPGDVIHRRMTDGDWIMMNRQPTLHKGSMIAFKARVRDTKTFGLNLATTKSFNADFDGDNMNGMVPQSTAAAVELAELSSVFNSLVIGTRANVCIVQDGLTGVYLMSKSREPLPTDVVNSIVFAMVGEDHVGAQERLASFKKRLGLNHVDARMLISLAFPDDFSFESSDGEFCVQRGLIMRGALTKRWLGSNTSSLVKVILFQYRSRECARFVDKLQFGATEYLSWRGFSVLASDFVYAGESVEEAVTTTVAEAHRAYNGIKNPKLRDARVRAVLDMAKDVGMRLVKNAAADSDLASMIDSGSKGDYFNVGQIRGTLGQQNLDGGFIVPQMNGGSRATVHYEHDISDYKTQIESRGFITSCFARGLSPREIVFHAMTGREGVCTSATLTAVSGYTGRRVGKFLEDIQVRTDGTIGDRVGHIFDFAYGGDGMNPGFKRLDFNHIIKSVGGEPPSKKMKLSN